MKITNSINIRQLAIKLGVFVLVLIGFFAVNSQNNVVKAQTCQTGDTALTSPYVVYQTDSSCTPGTDFNFSTGQCQLTNSCNARQVVDCLGSCTSLDGISCMPAWQTPQPNQLSKTISYTYTASLNLGYTPYLTSAPKTCSGCRVDSDCKPFEYNTSYTGCAFSCDLSGKGNTGVCRVSCPNNITCVSTQNQACDDGNACTFNDKTQCDGSCAGQSTGSGTITRNVCQSGACTQVTQNVNIDPGDTNACNSIASTCGAGSPGDTECQTDLSISATPVQQDVQQGQFAVYTVTVEYNKAHAKGMTFSSVYLQAGCLGFDACKWEGRGFVADSGYTDRGTLTMSSNTAVLRLTVYSSAATAIANLGISLQAFAGGLNNSNCYGYNAAPNQGSCQPGTTVNLNVVGSGGGSGVPITCDLNWHSIPGSMNTQYQPVGVYVPVASPAGAFSDSVVLAITGGDGRVYYQSGHLSGSNKTSPGSWQGTWSVLNVDRSLWAGAYLTTPPSGILSDAAPYISSTGNYTVSVYAKQAGGSAFMNQISNLSGWQGWYSGANQSWGTPSNFRDGHSGIGNNWNFRQNNGVPEYMCGVDVAPPCNTLTTRDLSGLSCTPGQNSLALSWTTAQNPKLSRQVVRVSTDQASTLSGSCANAGDPNYDPANCKDTATTSTNTFTATGLTAGTTYYARVAAICTNELGNVILSPAISTSCTTTGATPPACPALGSAPTVTVNPNPLLTGSGGQAALSNASGWTNVTYSYVQSGTNATVNASTGAISAPSTTGSLTVSAVGTAANGATNCATNSVTVSVNASASCGGGNITFSPASPVVGNTGFASLPAGFSNCTLSVTGSSITLNSPANSGNFTASAAGSSTVTGTNCTYSNGSSSVSGCSVSGSVNVTSGASCPGSQGMVQVAPSVSIGGSVQAQAPGGYVCSSFGGGAGGKISVASNGIVTGVSAGTDTVTATCTYNGVSCPVSAGSINVSNPPASGNFSVSPTDLYYTLAPNTCSNQQVTFVNTGGVLVVVKPITACENTWCGDSGSGAYYLNAPNGSDSTNVNACSGSFPPGTYNGIATWGGYDNSNNKITSDRSVNIHMTVTAPVPPPTYTYSVSSTLNFSATQNSATSSVLPANPQYITITNTGNQALDLTITNSNMSAWGTVGSNNVHLNPAGQAGYSQTLPITITSTSISAQTYTGTVSFTNAQAGNKSTTVNYTITSSGAGGVAPKVTLTCNGQANPTIDYNGKCTLAWDTQSTAPTTCTASGDWSGSKNINGGSEITASISAAKTYTITCTKAGFADAVSTVNVSMGPQSPGGGSGNTSIDNTVACSSVKVSVTDKSTNEDGFRVYRSTSADSSTAVKVGADIPSTNVAGTGKVYYVTDTGLTGGTNYFYWVTAYKGAYESPKDSGKVNNFPITAIPCTANMSTSDKDIVAVNGGAVAANACNGSTDALPSGMTLGVGSVLTFSINLCNQGGQGDATQMNIIDKFINLKIPTATNNFGFCFNGTAGNCVATGGSLLTRAGDCLGIGSISPGQYSVCTTSSPGTFTINLNSNAYKIPAGTNTYKVTFQAELVAPASCSSLNICRFQDYGTITYNDGAVSVNRTYSTPLLPFLNGKNTPTIKETR